MPAPINLVGVTMMCVMACMMAMIIGTIVSISLRNVETPSLQAQQPLSTAPLLLRAREANGSVALANRRRGEPQPQLRCQPNHPYDGADDACRHFALTEVVCLFRGAGPETMWLCAPTPTPGRPDTPAGKLERNVVLTSARVTCEDLEPAEAARPTSTQGRRLLAGSCALTYTLALTETGAHTLKHVREPAARQPKRDDNDDDFLQAMLVVA